MREQAAAYRELAANNRDDAAKDHERAKQWPADHEYHKEWEAQAASDEARAAQLDAEAQRLSAQADAADAQAAAEEKQADQLKQGIDPAKVQEIEDKQKTADEAKAAYDACVERVAKECPVEPGKFSISLGLSLQVVTSRHQSWNHLHHPGHNHRHNRNSRSSHFRAAGAALQYA